MATAWGDVFNAAKRRGEDPSYAAFLADEWEKRRKRMDFYKQFEEERQRRIVAEDLCDKYRLALAMFLDNPEIRSFLHVRFGSSLSEAERIIRPKGRCS